MWQQRIKSFLPHLLAGLIFIILIFSYFPELLDNKSIRMDDIEQHKGMSNELFDYRERTGEEALWSNSMFGGMPGYLVSVVYKGNFLKYVEKALHMGLPRPADSMWILMLGFYVLLLVLGARQPLAIVGAIAYCFTTHYLLIMEAGHMTKVGAISYLPFVYAGVIYAFRKNAIAGALITAVFLSLQIKATHYQITYYFAIIVLFTIIAFVIDALRKKELQQVIKPGLALLVAALLAVLSNFSSIYTIYDYGKDSIRGKSELTIKGETETDGLDVGYVTQYSYGIGETMSYMIPNIYGGASNLGLADQKEALKKADNKYRSIIAQLPQYWGETSTTGPFYAGAAMVFLFILGLFILNGSFRWVALSAVVLAFMLAWGKYFIGFTEFMLDFLPGYNKFRAVKMTLVISDFFIPLIGILALNKVVREPELLKTQQNRLYAAFGLTAGICLLLWAFPDMFYSFDYLNPAIEQQLSQMLLSNGLNQTESGDFMRGMMANLSDVRIHIFKADAMRAFLIISLVAGAVWLYLRMRFNAIILAALVGVVVVADLFSINKRYVNTKDFVSKAKFEIPFDPSAADESIFAKELARTPDLAQRVESYKQERMKQSAKGKGAAEDSKYRFRGLLKNTNYRVLNISTSTFNDAATSFFHKSVGGYSAAKLERYQEFIEFQLDTTMQQLFANLNNPMMRMNPGDAFNDLHALNMLNTRYVIYNPQAAAIENPNALGNAWFVEKISVVKDADEEIMSLSSINPANEALVDKRFEAQLNNLNPSIDSLASIQMTEYEPNSIKYEIKTGTPQVAIFSEIYYEKGWKSYLNGNEVPHFRANYILRGMNIPAGNHELIFKFEPDIYYSSEKVSMAASGFILLVVLGYLGLMLKQRNTAVSQVNKEA